MPKTILLPDCGKTVELKGLGFDEATEILRRREDEAELDVLEARENVRRMVENLYGEELFDEIRQSNRDVMLLVSETQRHTFTLPELAENS